MTRRANGDCFKVAAEIVLSRGGSARLVHAVVTGRGKLEGFRFVHAWVEQDDLVTDFANGLRVMMPVRRYRAAARIPTPFDVFAYTPAETWHRLTSTRNYGPWEPALLELDPDRRR